MDTLEGDKGVLFPSVFSKGDDTKRAVVNGSDNAEAMVKKFRKA